MSGLFGKKEKRYSEPIRWRRELKLGPGYLLLTLWILFTFILLGWVLLASFSTTKEIFSNKLLDSGFHFENYVKAWVNSNVSTIFFNSLFYSFVSCTLLIVICAPAAYALSRFDFVCNNGHADLSVYRHQCALHHHFPYYLFCQPFQGV